MIYFIIGLPGSGKTYWAQLLQKELSYDAIDLDQEIELQTRTTIAELFKISEHHFRQKEREILKSIIEQKTSITKHIIIATGGGTPCFYDNLELMKKSGKVLFLQSSIQNIVKKINHLPTNRPLLSANEEELMQQLMLLQKQRMPFYLQADHILDADKLTLPIFAHILNSKF